MNHYIPIIAPSRYIPMIAPCKTTEMSPQDTLIAPTETVIAPIDVSYIKETLLDGSGFVIAPIDVHHTTIKETLLDGYGLITPREGIHLEGYLDGQGLFIECAIHGKKTPKKKPKKIKAAGLEGTAVAGTEGCGGITPGGGGIKPGITILVKPIDPDWFTRGVEGTTAKPYGGDIKPGIVVKIKPCDPDLPKITVRIEGARDGWPGIGVKLEPIDPDLPKITVRVEGTRDITPGLGGGGIYPLPPWPKGGSDEVEPYDPDWPNPLVTVRTEGWGGGNCHEVYYGVEGHGGGINANTGGGTGCKPGSGCEGFGG